jgi:hypothetical protein
MISPREATLALMGAVRMGRFDEKGAIFFNATVQGFWNSFWVAALIAPFYLLELATRWHNTDIPDPDVVAADLAATDLSIGAFRYFSVELIMYAMSWVAFPLVMFYVCRTFDWSKRFLNFAVASNWTDLIASALSIPVQIAISLELLTGSAMSFMLALVIVYALGLSWFVARHTLSISALAATGVVSLSIFVNIIIRYWGAVLIAS